MFRFAAFCIVVVLTTIVTSIPTNPNDVEPVVIVDFNSGVEDIPDVEDQELFSSSKLSAIPAGQVEGTLYYRIGRRVSNDRIVSQNTDSHHWATPQNVTLILQYPSSGKGAVVTCVEVVVNQSSNIGLARVLAGGIGKRFITTIVEGNSTYWFSYSSKIYGV